MSLCEIFSRHSTDKNTAHTYGPIYEELLAPLRDAATSILEIGINRGGSLRAWRDYFKRAEIHGLDHRPECLFSEPRIATHLGNQNSHDDLLRIGQEHGPFDLIVDDGSHRLSDQLTSLLNLWAFLKPAGFYAIEDIQDPKWLEVLGSLPAATVYDRRALKGRIDDILIILRKPLDSIIR